MVAVSIDGLEKASNLIAIVGSSGEISARCNGWWLARVERLQRGSGEFLDLPDILEKGGGGRKKKKAKNKGGDEEKDEDGGDGDADDEEEEEGEDGEEMSASNVHVEVTFFGGRDSKRRIICKPDFPMDKDLGVTDVVPRSRIFFEEREYGCVKFRKNGYIFKPTLDKINQLAPAGKREEDDVEYVNHAGERIGANEGPSREEMPLWEAQASELRGWTYSIDHASDGSKTDYQVADIRRCDGRMFVTVRSSGGWEQADHELDDVREMRYLTVTQSAYEQVEARPPLMLQWGMLRKSHFAVDFEMLEENMKCYVKEIEK